MQKRGLAQFWYPSSVEIYVKYANKIYHFFDFLWFLSLFEPKEGGGDGLYSIVQNHSSTGNAYVWHPRQYQAGAGHS